MATVYIQTHKRKFGLSYCVLYRDPVSGRKRHFSSYRKKREASRAANDLRALIDTGGMPEPARTRISPLTFSEVAKSLKAEWQSRLEIKDLSQKTFDEYCIWLDVLIRRFGHDFLSSLTSERIEKHIIRLSKERSNVTANKYLSIIKKVFKHGLKINAVKKDHSRNVRLLSEKMHVRNKFLLPNELERLIEASQSNRGKFYMPAMILLGAEHGASRQEILSLKWSEINFDFNDGIGLIRLFRTKNAMERTELLMPRTREALLNWKNHLEWKRHRINLARKDVLSNHVFCRIDGTPIKRFDKAWKTALNKAGITDFHFHDLRHTFCSNLILSGSDLKDAKDMIGHSDLSMTDRYSHLTNSHKFLRQRKLAEHYISERASHTA
jgi:site-specific recombinase XerD